ncbi:ATP-binding protein [Desulfopila inferna]|uniref:ATP-binding protein n=1 Tax=Desulfopila inferna TaxID=468528 RepID=UPI001965704D|nr:ATP-binding protein [Desulfopila inferna]MBM9604437.1 PAS domain-containing protein [Desulfopila inferna]
MKQRKLIWQIFPANLLILLLTVACVTWFGRASLKSFYLDELEKGLISRAHLVKPLILEMLQQDEITRLRQYSKSAGREANTRITIIRPDGKVVADSNEDPSTMELHHTRTEVRAALQGNTGKSLRFSRTLGQEMLYVAIPIFDGWKRDTALPATTEIQAILRMSVAVEAIEVALQDIFGKILFGVFLFAFLAAAASLLVSRNISRPLEEIKRAAERYSNGDFSGKMTNFQRSASLEVVTLATAMEKMAAQLNERIETIKSQRNELETVFSSMVESVIAIDSHEHVININTAAAELLGIEENFARGKMVPEVLRNVKLQQQIKEVIRTGYSLQDEIVHSDNGGDRFLQTNIVPLNDQMNRIPGILVVLNDVTKLRRLENVRRDFVANVSHELRTPITSIRGYVETLLDGALENREDAVRFLKTVMRQAERLNEIIEDLLVLSRIEQEAEENQIKLETSSLCRVLEVAVETCGRLAAEKDISVSLACPESIQLKINETLMEQALVNLLVNAIKYSRKGDRIDVTASSAADHGRNVVKISVSDTGVGIASNHLSRLFERFYRSDKARSRKEGGTGLGLAIVKHIVLAHKGRIEVSSTPGMGSTFTITLPRNNSE